MNKLKSRSQVAVPLTLSQLMASSTAIPAISYGRVSSEKQLHGEGLRRQRKGTLDWIASRPDLHIRLDEEKTDAARSAWKGDHVKEDGALGSILRMVEKGDLGPPLALIVEALDRLSRENPWKAQSQLSGLVSRGIIVVTTRDNKVYSLESGVGDIIMSIVLMSAAHEESEKKSERVSETKAIRAKESMVTKQVLHKNVPGWLRVREAASATDRATRKCELLEGHGETVLIIFNMALNHGAAYITRWLSENRQPFGRSEKWNIRYVKNILASRAALGHLETRHGIIEDTFPRIVSDELWLRVQGACGARTGHGGQKLGTYVNLLAGISTCHACGGRMRINKHGGSGHRYYECEDHAVLHRCANRCRYRVDVVENAILYRFGLGWLEAETAPAAIDVRMLEATFSKLSARLQRLERKLRELDHDDMFDVVMGQLRTLRAEVQDAATRLNAARQASAVATATTRIKDMEDHAAIHTALKQRGVSASFADGNTVEIRAGANVLTVVARGDGPPPALAIEHRACSLKLVRLNAAGAFQIVKSTVA